MQIKEEELKKAVKDKGVSEVIKMLTSKKISTDISIEKLLHILTNISK